jgi:thiol-disulfide isomerase/thioredoxin
MTDSRNRFFALLLALAAICVVSKASTSFAAGPNGNGSSPDVNVSDKTGAGADQFAVPNGPPDQVLAYIEKIAHPQKQFASQDEMRNYFSHAAVAIGKGADEVLAASTTATDQQLTDAIEWKVESLRIKSELGDETAGKQTTDFLDSLKFDNRPTLVENIGKIRQNFELMQFQMKLASKLRAWPGLGTAERSEIINQFTMLIKQGDAAPDKVDMLIGFSDAVGDFGDSQLLAKMFREVMPEFRVSKDPAIMEMLPLLEGIGRRFDLPGHKLELSGNYLDGKPLDWDVYRGKVVLVDFWATWCGPCRAEVPNVLENYRKYHDKGFDVLGISMDEERGAVEQYMHESGVPWKTTFYVAPDAQHKQPPMAIKYGVTGIPRCILVDQKGNVVNINCRGPMLSTELAKLLGGQANSATGATTYNVVDEKTAQSGQ